MEAAADHLEDKQRGPWPEEDLNLPEPANVDNNSRSGYPPERKEREISIECELRKVLDLASPKTIQNLCNAWYAGAEFEDDVLKARVDMRNN